jgi:kanamycin kinase
MRADGGDAIPDPLGGISTDAVPAAVSRIADGRPLRLVWENEVGGLTFEMATPQETVFLKWSPAEAEIDLAQEAERLDWAAALTPAPRVLGHGTDDDGWWMVTTAMPGTSAVSKRWKSDPRTAVTAIAAGLRELHDTLPTAACPFSWSHGDRIADARKRASMGQLDPSLWHPEHRHLSVAEALGLLDDPPPISRLVVCHGDACAPNTLLDDEGRFAGHVDLGALGVADAWADLAIATWSADWNYGPGWDTVLLEVYGTEPDADRTRYYRLLYDLGP